MWADAECALAIMIADSIILPRYVRSFRPGHKKTGSSESSQGYGSKKSSGWSWTKASSSKQTAQSSRVEGFDWDQDGPLPQGEAFHQMADINNNTNTLHSRLSEELDLRPEDRARVAPWAEPDTDADIGPQCLDMKSNK